MNVINPLEFEKTLKKYNALKNEEIKFLDDILNKVNSLSLLYRTNQKLPDINMSLENKILTVKSLHENSYLYLTNIYNSYMEASGETSAIINNVSVGGGINSNE